MSTNNQQTNSSGEVLAHFDVLIIGAGPAGAGAATFLAHSGRAHAIDKYAFGSRLILYALS